MKSTVGFTDNRQLLHTRKRTATAAMAAIRQLCCMGLPAQTVATSLLSQINSLLPSNGSTLFWCSPDGQITNMISQQNEAMEILPLYFNEFHEKREREVFLGWSESLRFTQAAHFDQMLRVPRKQFLKHEFYGEILSVIGMHYGLCLTVRDEQACRGFLHLHRRQDNRDYSAEERQTLDQIHQYLAHIMGNNEVLGATSFLQSDDVGDSCVFR